MFKAFLTDRSHRTFLLLFLFALALRLAAFTPYLLDQHGWRQSSSAIVARNYLENMNLFKPKVDMLAPGYPSAFGFYEYYVALLAQVFGFSVALGRFFSLFLFMVGFVYFYRLVNRLWGHRVALWSSFIYALLPVSSYYARSFQPDSGMVSFTIVFLFYFTRWVEENRWSDWGKSVMSGFMMLSLKIVALYMFIPAFAYLFMYRRWKACIDVRFFGMAMLAAALPLYYHHIVPLLSDGFFTNAFTHQDKWANGSILLTFDFWFKLLLPWGNLWEYQYMHAGYILLVLGLFKKVTDRRQWVLYVWMGAVFLFFISAAYGMHHEYYSLPLMPIACLFIGWFLADFYQKHPWSLKSSRLKNGLVSFMVLYVVVFSFIRLHDRCDMRSSIAYLPMASVIKGHTTRDDIVLFSTKGFEELQFAAHRRGLHIRPPFAEQDPVEANNQRLEGWYGAHGGKIKLFAIADYDLKQKSPTLYELLKQKYTLIYERNKEYIFLT